MTKEDINRKIKELEVELSSLKESINKKEFEFKYIKNDTFCIGSYIFNKGCDGQDKDLVSNFRYRQLETNAKADFQLQKELMCIGALAEQIDPDYKPRVPSDKSGNYCYIYYGKESNKYHYSRDTFTRTLGVVYMPQEVAEKVCEILNNKEVAI